MFLKATDWWHWQYSDPGEAGPLTPGFGDLPPFIRFRFRLMGAVRRRPIFRSFQRLSSGHSCCLGWVQNQPEPSAGGAEGSGSGSWGWCRRCCPASLPWCVGQVRSTAWAPQPCSASNSWPPSVLRRKNFSRLMKCCGNGRSSAAGAQPQWPLGS